VPLNESDHGSAEQVERASANSVFWNLIVVCDGKFPFYVSFNLIVMCLISYIFVLCFFAVRNGR
jgi:hypothetical protein